MLLFSNVNQSLVEVLLSEMSPLCLLVLDFGGFLFFRFLVFVDTVWLGANAIDEVDFSVFCPLNFFPFLFFRLCFEMRIVWQVTKIVMIATSVKKMAMPMIKGIRSGAIWSFPSSGLVVTCPGSVKSGTFVTLFELRSGGPLGN